MGKRSRREQRLADIDAQVVEQAVSDEKAAKTAGAADDALFFVDVPAKQKGAASSSSSSLASALAKPSRKRARVEESTASKALTTSVAVVSAGQVKLYQRKVKPVVPPSEKEQAQIKALLQKAHKVQEGQAKAMALQQIESEATVTEAWDNELGQGRRKKKQQKAPGEGALLRPPPAITSAGGIPALSVNPSVDDHQEALAVAAAQVIAQDSAAAALAASLAGPADKGRYYASLDERDLDYDDDEEAEGSNSSAAASAPTAYASVVASGDPDAEFLAAARAIGSQGKAALTAASAPSSYSLSDDIAQLASAIEEDERRTSGGGGGGKGSASHGGGALGRKHRKAAAAVGALRDAAFIPPLSHELTGSLRTMKVVPAPGVAAEQYRSLIGAGLAGSNGAKEWLRSKKAAAAARTKPGKGFPYRKVEFPRRGWEGEAMQQEDDE